MTPAKPRVLVVDDDTDQLALVEFQLKEHFEVFTAGSGRRALELAQIHPLDVILLDIKMPEMDGREVAAELTSRPATHDVPIIYLTAMSEIDDRVAGLDGGAVDYVIKPAEVRELIARVWAAARTKALLDEAMRRSSADPITGLEGRKTFEARLAQECARSRRSGDPITVFIADVDHMEQFNEHLGRDFGNELLGRIASVLRNTLRASDSVFRYGGDEFAAILPGAAVGAGFQAAERCREAIRDLAPSGRASLSIGLAELTPGRSAHELLAKAEIALFRAKESGGGCSWRADDLRRRTLSAAALAEGLTDREWTVLKMLAERRSENEIASEMDIKTGTVRSHKARIRRKLNVAPEERLTAFIRDNFRDLVARIGDIEIEERT
jgi:diguanylate cyclase (GGDEF)-like protein